MTANGAWITVDGRLQPVGQGETDVEPDQPTFTQQDVAVATLLEAKAKGDREWAQHEQRMFAGRSQGRAAMTEQLRASVPPALFTAVETAHQALLLARRQAAQKRQELTQIEQARPKVAADVTPRAQQLAILRGEVEGFEGIVLDAEQAHQAAAARLQQAIGQAWHQGRAAAVAAKERREAAFGRRMEQMRTELNAAFEDGRREVITLQEAVNAFDQYQPDGQW